MTPTGSPSLDAPHARQAATGGEQVWVDGESARGGGLSGQIRLRVTTVDTGVSVNIGVIVFEGASTDISAQSPETKGFGYFGLNLQ